MRASIHKWMNFAVCGLAASLLPGCAKNSELAAERPPGPATDAGDATMPLPSAVDTSCKAGAWCRVTLPRNISINGIWGASADDVWLAGTPGTALHWNGRGLDAHSIDTAQALSGVWGSSASDVWMFTTSASIWHFDQSTNSWSRSLAKTGRPEPGEGYPTPVAAMWGTSNSDVWAVGASILQNSKNPSPPVYHSDGWRNGDPNWQVVATAIWDPPTVEYITMNAICGGAKAGVWLVGDSGKTRYSSGWVNGGAKWGSLNTQTTRNLFGVWCSPDGEVWAVGDKGTILRFTLAEGDSYNAESFGPLTNKSLRAVWGASPTDIWAVGDAGTVLRWDGTSWMAAKAPLAGATSEDLFTIWGESAQEIWIGGRNVLLHNGISESPGASL